MKRTIALLIAFFGMTALVQTSMSMQSLPFEGEKKEEKSYLKRMKERKKESEERIKKCLLETTDKIQQNNCFVMGKLESALETACSYMENIDQQVEKQCEIALEKSEEFKKLLSEQIDKFSENMKKLDEANQLRLTKAMTTFQETLPNTFANLEKNIGQGLSDVEGFNSMEKVLGTIEKANDLLVQQGNGAVDSVQTILEVERKPEKEKIVMIPDVQEVDSPSVEPKSFPSKLQTGKEKLEEEYNKMQKILQESKGKLKDKATTIGTAKEKEAVCFLKGMEEAAFWQKDWGQTDKFEEDHKKFIKVVEGG